MTLKEIHEVFNEAEAQFPVYTWRLKEVDVWPLVRYNIYDYFKADSVSSKSTSLTKTLFQELSNMVSLLWRTYTDRKKNDKIRQSDIVFITHPTRRISIEHSYYDRITDPFVEQLSKGNMQSLTLEWSYDHSFRFPRYNKSKIIQIGIYKTLAKAMLSKSTTAKGFNTLERYPEFLNFLHSKGLNIDKFNKKLSEDYFKVVSLSKYFEKLFKTIAPKKCFYFPYYSLMGFATTLACKNLKIQSIEIQHGYASSMHIGYAGNDSLRPPHNNLLPDCIWCWDSFTTQIIKKWANPNFLTPIVGGNLWIDAWKAKRNLPITEIIDKEVLASFGKKTPVVITLTNVLILPDFLSSTILDHHSQNYFYFIRFHHNMSAKDKSTIRNTFAKCDHVDFDVSNKYSLLDLLLHCKLHITINSSALIEAKQLGIPTVIISEEGAKAFHHEVELGNASVALNKEELIESLKALASFSNLELYNEATISALEFIEKY